MLPAGATTRILRFFGFLFYAVKEKGRKLQGLLA
jgi:hypothetical protein